MDFRSDRWWRGGVIASVDSTDIEDGAPDEGSADDISLGRRLLSWQTIVSFALGIGLLVLLLTRVQVDLRQTLATIAQTNVGLFLLALFVYYLGFPIRGLRWRQMLLNAGAGEQIRKTGTTLAQLTEILYLSWFVNCLVPAKLGDVFRAYLLKQRTGVRGMRTVGTVVAERILDLTVLLLLLAGTGWLTLRDKVPAEVQLAIEIGLALLGVAGLGLLAMRYLDALFQRLVPARFHSVYERFHQGILLSFRGFPSLLGYTLLVWLTETARLALVSWSIGLRLAPDPLVELGLFVFIALAAAALTAIPATPAGLGIVDGLIVTSFTWIGLATGTIVSPAQATAVAVLDRSISYGSLVLFGAIVYLVSSYRTAAQPAVVRREPAVDVGRQLTDVGRK
ncbi:MAG: flippase-like domain-containing protein [Chloroflexi bacterium]|nr:flippase-like domain-containing protein [Chloroflexota bacterium]